MFCYHFMASRIPGTDYSRLKSFETDKTFSRALNLQTAILILGQVLWEGSTVRFQHVLLVKYILTTE